MEISEQNSKFSVANCRQNHLSNLSGRASSVFRQCQCALVIGLGRGRSRAVRGVGFSRCNHAYEQARIVFFHRLEQLIVAIRIPNDTEEGMTR